MFNEFLTTEGERLLAKSIAGTATITFTKMELGDGDRGTASKNITSLESKRMTLDIYSVQLSGDNHITITSMLKSENIEAGFYFREKAVYATDGTTEILFMYGTAGSLAEWIENNNISVFERTIRTIIALSDGDSVNVTIQEGVYASGEDVKNILTAISNIKLDGDWAKFTQAESILSILDTFVAAYTAARAGKLDNLDALVSSRAPANTALSNATWTNARAALLDNLDAKISSRAPASTALSTATWTNARATAIDTINTNAARLTAARAGYLDYLAHATYGLPALQALIGATANTGGTASAGTAMAKLNAILTGIDAVRSASGYYKPSNNLRHTLVSQEVEGRSPSASLKAGGFYAAKSGCIRVVATLRSTNSNYNAHLDVPKYSVGTNTGTPKVTSGNFYQIERGNATLNTGSLVGSNSAVRLGSTKSVSYVTIERTLWVEKGEYVAFYLAVEDELGGACCDSLKIYYDEVN